MSEVVSASSSSEDPPPVPIRVASCVCGGFKLTCQGNPRISICHCFACQQRTGSTFGTQARYSPEQILNTEGEFKIFKRTGDAGAEITSKFCPNCGTTICWTISVMPDLVAVAVGCFSDPHIGSPVFSVYEARKHDWVQVPTDITHWD